MVTTANSLLVKANKAFQAEKYEEAISFYTEAMLHLPALEKNIAFNISLAESRLNSESITRTILKREMTRYINETQKENKTAITVLLLTSDCDERHLEDAYIAAEILEQIVSHTIFSCLQTKVQNQSSLSVYARKSIPIIAISGDSQEDMLNNISKKFTPDFVLYCGNQNFLEPISRSLQEKNIPLALISSADQSLLSHTKQGQVQPIDRYARRLIGHKSSSVVTPIDARKSFIEPYPLESPCLKIKPLCDSVLTNDLRYAFKPDRGENTILRGKDIVMFWKQNDTGLYGRRPDMIAKYLASRPNVRKVIIIDAPIEECEIIAKKTGARLTHDRDIYQKTYEKLFCQLDSKKISHHVYISKNHISYDEDYEKAVKNNFYSYGKYLEKVFLEEGITTQDSIFWFYPKNYFAADIIEIFRPKKVVVDIVDDHRAWPGVPSEEKEKLTKHYRHMLAKADLCIANCQAVVDSMKAFNSSILMIPNGCEEQLEIIEPLHNKAYNEIKSFKGNVLGFVGNLESKIDISLLEKLAKEFADSLIVLVGSTHANPNIRDLEKYSNIKLTGVVEYKYINAIVNLFTVGIVPHLRTSLTENMNPLKVFVYATNRIPIVCSNIDNLPKGDFIHVTRSHEEFIEACNLTLQHYRVSDHNSYAEFVEMNSWSSRFNELANQL